MTTGTLPAGARELVLRAYAAYNTQDLDRLLALVGDDVDWPDDDGGRLHGKEALRAYWTEQWTRIRVRDQPSALSARDDGRIEVHIDQIARSLDGSLLSTRKVEHVLRIEGDRITRLDIVPPADT